MISVSSRSAFDRDRINKIIDHIHDESRTLRQVLLDVMQIGIQIEDDDTHDPVVAAKRLEKLRELRSSLEAAELKYQHRCEVLQAAKDEAAAESELSTVSA